MSWDDNIKNLPDQQGPFIDMLDSPQTTDEVQRLGAPIIIPADRTVQLWFAVREPSTEVPITVETWVNGVKYSEVQSEVELIGNTFLVNYAASRVKFAQSEVGKAISKLLYQNWGTQNRALFYIQGYQGLRDIRAVAQRLFNALEANENFHIKIEADNETQLYTNFHPAEYPGADAYAGGQKYYSNGLNWVKLEDITALDPVPQVLSVSPSLGQTSVALPANVEITFSQSMNSDDLLLKFSLKDRNANLIAGAFRFYDKNGMEVISSSSKIRKMLFDPTTDLTIEASPYYVELLPCENILGTQMVASFTSNFSCAADMLPTRCQITTGAIDGATVEVIMITHGSDYEGQVWYDVYLRNVTANGSFAAVTGHQGLTAAEFSRTIPDLSTTTNYEVLVKTRDSSGQTVDSNILAFQTSGVINNAPSAPVISLVSVGDGVITIRLDAASVDTEDGVITNYNIYVNGGLYAQDVNLNVGGTTQITGVTNGQSYSITSKGKDSGGKLSSPSSAVGATPSVNASPTISGLSATGIASNVNFKGTITDAESNTITGLKIQRRPAGGADWVAGMVEHVTTNATDIANFRGVGGLDIAGTYSAENYDYRVSAMDSGSGVYGAWVESLFASGGGFEIVLAPVGTVTKSADNPLFFPDEAIYDLYENSSLYYDNQSDKFYLVFAARTIGASSYDTIMLSACNGNTDPTVKANWSNPVKILQVTGGGPWWANSQLYGPCLRRETNGVWYIFLQGRPSSNLTHRHIGRAICSAGADITNMNNWSLQAEPAVPSSGNDANFDGRSCVSPNLYKENGTWYMFFSARGTGNAVMSLATGGASLADPWTKTGQILYTADITIPWCASPSFNVGQNEVIKVNDKYYILMTGVAAAGQPLNLSKLGFISATNLQGPWAIDTAPNNPIIGAGSLGLWDDLRPLYGAIIGKGNWYYVTYSGEKDDGSGIKLGSSKIGIAKLLRKGV